ncbi:hypothetical protein PAHAL_1G307900 [Panicum hallii]|uniref:Uncharacterized protein n=1 Tax=Panicum hallii TaxID=206008 RepID=A0A2T8KWV5_9POAL|nr:hypothetical protein PAHAL_1G307900 [Panicum hallii]
MKRQSIQLDPKGEEAGHAASCNLMQPSRCLELSKHGAVRSPPRIKSLARKFKRVPSSWEDSRTLEFYHTFLHGMLLQKKASMLP